jgi:hypothetical protein
VARAWGWVHHPPGGATPWSQWREPAPPAEQAGRYLPGAQQLELLRRLNLAGPRRPSWPSGCSRPAPGAACPTSAWWGASTVRFRTTPVDPSDSLPTSWRVATALAEDVVAAGDPDRHAGSSCSAAATGCSATPSSRARSARHSPPTDGRRAGRRRPWSCSGAVSTGCLPTSGRPARSVPASGRGATTWRPRYAVARCPRGSTSLPWRRPGAAGWAAAGSTW